MLSATAGAMEDFADGGRCAGEGGGLTAVSGDDADGDSKEVMTWGLC